MGCRASRVDVLPLAPDSQLQQLRGDLASRLLSFLDCASLAQLSAASTGVRGWTASFTTELTLPSAAAAACLLDRLRCGVRGGSSLQRLECQKGAMADVSSVLRIAQVIGGCSRLQVLDLQAAVLNVELAEDVSRALPLCPLLVDVRLSGVEEFGSLASALRLCSRLRCLALRFAGESEYAAAEVADAVPFFPALRELQLSGNRFPIDGIHTLLSALAARCGRLQSLSLCDNDLGGRVDSGMVAALARCVSLRQLDLSRNALSTSDMAALAEAISSLAKLKQLRLAENDVGQAGAAAIADALICCPALEALDLSGNALGDGGAAKLAPMLYSCSRLRSVALSCCGIGESGALSIGAALSKHTDLRVFRMAGSALSVEAQRELLDALGMAVAVTL